jgi:hypothetical protein
VLTIRACLQKEWSACSSDAVTKCFVASTQVAKYFRDSDAPFATEMKLKCMLHFTRPLALYLKASVKIKTQALLL